MKRRDFLQAAGVAFGAAAIASPALTQGGTAMPSFDQTPDRPRPFGYKVSWFAVKAPDTASVLDALELGERMPANWAAGIAAAYSHSQISGPWVFASPPVGGWVLVVGSLLPYPVAPAELHHEIGRKFDVLFSRLMKRFDDVQFFGSYRVVGFTAWARALKGKPVRVFAYADGEVLANDGEQTPEEAKQGFANLGGLSPSDARDKIFKLAEELEAEENALIASGLSPREALARLRASRREPIPGEGEVVELAALWSIDPTQLSHQDHPAGVGMAAPLPKDLTQ
jgi:hypothetical protein